MPLVIASPIPVAPTPTPSWTQNPHPGRGTSPTLPGGLLLVPPVLVAQTISPDLSLATTPMVSVAPSKGGLPCTFDFSKPLESAHSLAPSPLSPLMSSSRRSAATRIGLGVSCIAMTKPILPSDVWIDASRWTDPSVLKTEPVPALKTGSSSNTTHASTAASMADPPESRIPAALATALSTFASLSGPAPAPPCATTAGIANLCASRGFLCVV